MPPLLTRAPSTQNSIPDLRRQLDSIDSKLKVLMSQRNEIELHLERAVRLGSPILRLPSELLSSIFVMGARDAEEETAVPVPILMLVCRYWAQIAIDTPALWSTISVNAHDSVAKARTRIERSKSSLLDLSISFDARGDRVSESVIKAMDLFVPALWRTRSFVLSVPTKAQAHSALQKCQAEEAPYLERLTVNIQHVVLDDHAYAAPPLPLFKGHTPRLRHCNFVSFNFGWDIRLLTGLKSLHLSGYFNGFSANINTLMDALKACPQLETLELRNMSDVDADGRCGSPYAFDHDVVVDPRRMITLPKLTSMTFNNAGLIRILGIMNHISFPALQTFELYYLQDVTSVLQRLHNQSLTRLPLKHLRIESCFFNEQLLFKLLQRISLTQLELVDVEDASSALLKGMSTVKPWVCPRLTSLTLDGCTSIDWDALRAFVESRLPANRTTFSTGVVTSSASEYAKRQAASKAATHTSTHPAPLRIEFLDVSRCHQLSREMIQWLKMYVAKVKCEKAKCYS